DMGGAVEVSDAAELADGMAQWLEQPNSLAGARAAAGDFVAQQQNRLAGLVETLCAALRLAPDA
ncbi:MAG: hypothetical protein ACPGSW_11125, partial [Phaeobacter italicus]